MRRQESPCARTSRMILTHSLSWRPCALRRLASDRSRPVLRPVVRSTLTPRRVVLTPETYYCSTRLTRSIETMNDTNWDLPYIPPGGIVLECLLPDGCTSLRRPHHAASR